MDKLTEHLVERYAPNLLAQAEKIRRYSESLDDG